MIRKTLVLRAPCAVVIAWVATVLPHAAQPSGGNRFVDKGVAILDTQTNLLWEKKTTEVGSGSNPANLHDVDNTYNWCRATGNSEGPRCLGNTTSWIAEVNAAAFGGFTDWRLPTREELLAIIDERSVTCRKGSACIETIFGPTQPSEYWSTTEVSPNVAWTVVFYDGNLKFGTKNAEFHVRAVRSVS